MIYDLMKRRRSIRKYKPEMPSDQDLKKLIEAAVTAPSANNRQLWRFFIVKNRECIESAAQIVERERNAWIQKMQSKFQRRYEEYSQNFLIFQKAPVLIVPIYRETSVNFEFLAPETSEKDRMSCAYLERHSSSGSIFLAIQNLLLMAEELDLGACCMTGPLIAHEQLKSCFHVPEDWNIACIVTVGFSDEKPSSPGRKPVETVIRWL